MEQPYSQGNQVGARTCVQRRRLPHTRYTQCWLHFRSGSGSQRWCLTLIGISRDAALAVGSGILLRDCRMRGRGPGRRAGNARLADRGPTAIQRQTARICSTGPSMWLHSCSISILPIGRDRPCPAGRYHHGIAGDSGSGDAWLLRLDGWNSGLSQPDWSGPSLRRRGNIQRADPFRLGPSGL